MDSGERGMNPVAMTIINPWKEFGRAGDRTSNLMFSSSQRYRLSYGVRLQLKGPGLNTAKLRKHETCERKFLVQPSDRNTNLHLHEVSTFCHWSVFFSSKDRGVREGALSLKCIHMKFTCANH